MCCKKHYQKTNAKNLSCDDFQLRTYIINNHDEEPVTEISNTKTGMIYGSHAIVQRLNDLEQELIAYKKLFLETGEKNHLEIQSILAKYASQYPRGSDEFQLLCKIGDELGVVISLFGASDDD